MPKNKELNPIYKRDVIPQSQLPTKLILPVEKIGLFVDHEKQIYAMAEETKKYLDLQNALSSTKGKYCIVHEVKPGEFFHKIAMKYGCTVHNIQHWNKLDSLDTYIGQQLKIWTYPSDTIVQKPKRDPVLIKSKFLLYEVQKGDSFQSIANRFQVESVSDLIEVNSMSRLQSIEPGMVLKIAQYE